jgi:capsular exopolysaccharide synthesis family protein
MDKIEEIISLFDSHEKRETKNFFLKYLKQWPWFVVLSFIGIFFGYLYYKNSPLIFEVNSRILIKSENTSLSDLLSFDNPINVRDNINLENKIGTLKSYTLFSEAVKNLNWETSWYKKELLYKKELYNITPFELIVPPNANNAKNIFLEIAVLNDKEYRLKVKGESSSKPVNIENVIKFGEPFANDFFNFTLNKGQGVTNEVFYLVFNDIQVLTNSYLEKTEISREDLNSDIISIKIEGENVQKEADFINELNNVYINYGVSDKNKNSESSLQFIDSQIVRIQGALSIAQNNFSSYRRNNQAMDLGQEAQLVYTKLDEIENEKYLTELQINFYNELQHYLDDAKKIEQMINPSVIGITDENLNTMLTKLMDLYSRREVLTYSVQNSNPSMILIEKEIKLTRDALEETLKNQLRATESKMESMKERFTAIESRLKELPETEKQLIGIQREFDLNNELYTYMMQKKAEASITKASIAPEVQVIDAAFPEASTEIGPNWMLNVFGGMVGGIMLPFIFITLIGFFNNKIETRDEIEKNSKLPVLEGIIRHKYKEILPVVYHPRSGIAESFRGLKSNLKALLEEPGAKVISVNSLIPGEGKSFISSNFSAILAKTNKKVLLVGADLHKPTLHKYFEVKESFGLSNFFLNEKSFEEIISGTFIPNLSFIQAGVIPDNPSELLDNEKFEILIEKARQIFDFIIIDNAPVLLVPDSILVSNFSDVSLFVLRINLSHKDQIKQIGKIVEFNKIKNAAILINEAPDRGYGYGSKYWKHGYADYRKK